LTPIALDPSAKPPSLLRNEAYVDGLLASAFYAFGELVGCGHMSGLLVRRDWLLALMKSDEPGSDQSSEL
jgi:hypothetical protein